MKRNVRGLALAVAGFSLTIPWRAHSQPSPSEQLSAFIDDFVSPAESAAPSDMGAADFANELAETRALLARLGVIDTDRLSVDERIDWRFAESILLGREIEQARIQSWKKDPRVYMGFRALGRVIGRLGDPDEKNRELLLHLGAVPRQLESGRRNLVAHVPRFRELSVFMAEGARGIFARDVPAFAKTVPSHEKTLLEANRAAEASLAAFLTFLKTELPKLPEGDWAIGEATYDALLEHQYLLPYDSDGLYEFGWREFERTVAEMEELAKRIDPSQTWQQLAIEIKKDYPPPDEMIAAHQKWVDLARDHVRNRDLVPIPWKERVEVVPRAEYLRKTSYYGNFSRAREAKDGVLVAQWMINPFEEQWDARTKQEYLVEHDWGVIIVTAPHETYAGHHVQGLYQMHNPRKLRRAHGTPIFSEGWGLYNEQLMLETGFFPDDRIRLRQLQLRLWRNARVIWDVGIHTGRMSYDEAVSLLSDRVGFLRWAAELEVDGSAESPGYRLGYFMGMSEILKMREELEERLGERFSLSDFHERLLKVGNMPPALMREGLMASLESAGGN